MDTTVNFPKTLVDLDGSNVNVYELSRRYVLIFITLKATWCPVCPQLLYILNLHGLHDDPPSSFRDAFDRTIITVPQEEITFYRLLLRQDAFFIIICPGPVREVLQIRSSCNFSHFPYHFIVDEDLSLATSIGLRMSREEIWPCIAHIKPTTLAVHPIFFGRGPGFYGYKDLLNYLHDYRATVEYNATNLILKATEIKTRLEKSVTIENSAENVQQQIIQTDQPQQNRPEILTLPIEILIHIFENLETIEVFKIVMSTSRLWRAIGLEVILINLRNEVKQVSDSLVTNIRDGSPNYSLINKLRYKNKLDGVYQINQKINKLITIIEISQRIVIKN
ncbi:18325_t:CDS:2 [Funneliformis geosporum]|uniref:18325_t:CDS:1 n=1 Tax=Funneliformis geosporum TaxID=1117311 RepID=A0A9W4SUC3_9GLOM|nr:18325_t:CDS:2 [Funneliformis geosporum]